MLSHFPCRKTAWILLPLICLTLVLGPVAAAFAAEAPHDEVTVEGKDRSTSQVPGSGAVSTPVPESGADRQVVNPSDSGDGRDEAKPAETAPRTATPRQKKSDWWMNATFWLIVAAVAGAVAVYENNHD